MSFPTPDHREAQELRDEIPDTRQSKILPHRELGKGYIWPKINRLEVKKTVKIREANGPADFKAAMKHPGILDESKMDLEQVPQIIPTPPDKDLPSGLVWKYKGKMYKSVEDGDPISFLGMKHYIDASMGVVIDSWWKYQREDVSRWVAELPFDRIDAGKRIRDVCLVYSSSEINAD